MPYQFLLKSIFFKVCEHEYMNISPPPPHYRSSAAPAPQRPIKKWSFWVRMNSENCFEVHQINRKNVIIEIF